MDFSEDFIWGVAACAAQVEGAASEDGRGPSIWDTFAKTPGRIADGTTPAVTCDQYHRLEEHIAFMKSLGIKSYRFSVSWSRIMPEGTGKINQKGIDYYKKLVRLLKENDIIPNLTLYHWDLPEALSQKGGFANRDFVKWYTDYAKVVFDTFGDEIDYYATFNEPISVYVGYGLGRFAPGISDEKTVRAAMHHLLVAHGEAVKLFRTYNFKRAKIGIVVDMWHHYPLRPDNADDISLAEFNNETAGYGMFLNPVFLGAYQERCIEYMKARDVMPDILPGDMASISSPIDFYGLNFYNGIFDKADGPVRADGENRGMFQCSDPSMQGIYHHQALGDCLKILKEKYKVSCPIIITESGYDAGREPYTGEEIRDDYRIEYIKKTLTELSVQIKAGYDVRGYYLWTLLDNWEWCAGYTARFGLASVDFTTCDFVPKKSAYYYKKVIETGNAAPEEF